MDAAFNDVDLSGLTHSHENGIERRPRQHAGEPVRAPSCLARSAMATSN